MGTQQKYDQKQLLLRIANGDENAFNELVSGYASFVYGFVKRLTKEREFAEEVTQDVFLQLWNMRETLTGVENFDGYLFMITRNYALNALKKMLRQKKRQVLWEDAIVNETTIAESDAIYHQLLDQAIDLLAPQQQRVWILSRHHRMTYQEIADELHLSKDTVKKYLQAATLNITEYLKSRGDAGLVSIFLFFIK